MQDGFEQMSLLLSQDWHGAVELFTARTLGHAKITREPDAVRELRLALTQ